jgi:hypothetical protein
MAIPENQLKACRNTVRLRGNYFTGRRKETRGEITLHRVSRELPGYDAALKKEKE